MIYKNIEFYREICCELCMETMHNHFECPVCNDKYAGTSFYGDIEDEKEFKCEECNTKFEIVKKNNWYNYNIKSHE